MRTVGRSRLLLALVLLAAGCTSPPGAVGDERGVPYPAGCSEFDLSERRCTAIVEAMAERAKVDLGEAREVRLLGDPGCGQGPGVVCMRSTSFVVRVRFQLADGRMPEESVFCGIESAYSILCTETPEIRLSSPMMGGGGYHDVPCAGEPPDGCASPVATADPAAQADARPLEIASLDVPIDHVGAYDVPIGEAALANGLLADATFTLADLHPDTFLTTEDGVRMELRSLDGGGSFWNVYEHGWRPGVERVEVRLVFEVAELEPGALLQVRDVVVR